MEKGRKHPASTALQPVSAQALPSQEPATASFSPGLHLPSLPLSVSQKPEVSPHLCPQSPFLLPLGICRGVCMCVCVSLPRFSGHLQCVCVHVYVCPGSVRTRPEAEERGSCHCISHLAIPPGARVGEEGLGAPGWTGLLQFQAESLEIQVLTWVSLGKNEEAVAAGGTSGLERA